MPYGTVPLVTTTETEDMAAFTVVSWANKELATTADEGTDLLLDGVKKAAKKHSDNEPWKEIYPELDKLISPQQPPV